MLLINFLDCSNAPAHPTAIEEGDGEPTVSHMHTVQKTSQRIRRYFTHSPFAMLPDLSSSMPGQ
jgi:hypothetical protein